MLPLYKKNRTTRTFQLCTGFIKYLTNIFHSQFYLICLVPSCISHLIFKGNILFKAQKTRITVTAIFDRFGRSGKGLVLYGATYMCVDF